MLSEASDIVCGMLASVNSRKFKFQVFQFKSQVKLQVTSTKRKKAATKVSRRFKVKDTQRVKNMNPHACERPSTELNNLKFRLLLMQISQRCAM